MKYSVYIIASDDWIHSRKTSYHKQFNNKICSYQKHIFMKSSLVYFEPMFLYMEGFWQELHAERLKLLLYGQANYV